MTALRGLAVAGLALVGGWSAVGAAPAVAQEAATDTLEVPAADADSLARDSARAELAARREALSAGGFPERDSVFRRLLRLPGFRAVEYRGERVELEVGRERVELRGDAQANYGESVLEADSISYLAALQFLRAGGTIRLSAQGRDVRSDSVLYYDISRLKGTIMGARTTFAERGAEWYVRGTATPKGDRTVYVERGSFTTCELEEPHYWFQAGKIKVVSENYIVAWPVVFYLHGIPVAWLPFFAQDIRPGRRSGLLPPRFGFNDIVRTGNTARSVSDFGYYFALSPYTDARFTVDWLSGRYTRLNGAFRYRFMKKFLEGNLRTSYELGDGGRNFRIDGRHDQELTPKTDFRANFQYVRNTRLFEDRTFDPTEQTQDVRTDVGFNHRFDFATLNLSANRRQRIGAQTGLTDLELPQLRMSFSPVTLFRAPPLTAGPFNNLTWSGNVGFNRQVRLDEAGDDRTTTTANYGNSLRLGRLNLSGSANLVDLRTVPLDSLGAEGDPFTRTTLSWSSRGDFQVDLMGSTVLRPTVTADGTRFKSPETEGSFVTVPTRLRLGATLSTDLFAFLPGFGPLTRIRHKFSPNFDYAYSPAVEVADSLLQIPGFPGGGGAEQNRLSVRINQTFEAKVRPRREPGDEAADEAADADAGRQAAEEAGAGGDDRPDRPARSAARPRPQAAQERTIVLLGINSSPLQFDFARENEPALITDRWNHSITSDLLRGFSFNLGLDLFEGSGEERRLSPVLSQLTGSFSLDSRAGLGGLFGLRGPTGAAAPRGPMQGRRGPGTRYRRGGFGPDFESGPVEGGAGPWNLSVNYSLSRTRAGEPGEGRQSLGGNLRLAPTPNWRIQWRTQYDLSGGEFVLNSVFLERDLHRWQAFFGFTKTPSGNVQFQVMVNLIDAPEVRLDWDQQTLTGS